MHIYYHANVFIKPLPSNDRGIFTKPLSSNKRGMHIQTHRLMGGIYEVCLEMGSGVMKYIPSFIKIGSAIRKLRGGGGGIHRHTDILEIPYAYVYFFKMFDCTLSM
jgi:hypothetical protein